MVRKIFFARDCGWGRGFVSGGRLGLGVGGVLRGRGPSWGVGLEKRYVESVGLKQNGA